MNKDCDIYKVVCGGLMIACVVLILIVNSQRNHINYLEGLAKTYLK